MCYYCIVPLFVICVVLFRGGVIVWATLTRSTSTSTKSINARTILSTTNFVGVTLTFTTTWWPGPVVGLDKLGERVLRELLVDVTARAALNAAAVVVEIAVTLRLRNLGQGTCPLALGL